MAKRGRPPKIRVIKLPEVPPTYELPASNGPEKIVIQELPTIVKRKEFRITFTSIPERVICPSCKALQFTVNQGSTNAEIVRVCKCGARTTYIFAILPFGIATSSPLQ